MIANLPWPKPPLTGNRTRGNPYARANEVKQAKVEAQWAIRADVPCERCVFIPTPNGQCICREVKA